MTKKPLTLLTEQGGCAAKVGPQELYQIIDSLIIDEKDEITLLRQREDAGYFSFSNDLTIIQSIDAITPISDNPVTYGAIATAHALNDIYAKGANPISGLFLLGFPALQISTTLCKEILQGAIDKLFEAKAKFLGGHTIANQQLQLGVAVTGLIQDKFIPNNTCQEGDALILTKPLGTGIIITALKYKNAKEKIQSFSNELVKISEEKMLCLNQKAADSMIEIGVNACTDISGFGLIGHLCQMLKSTNLTAQLNWDNIPILPGVMGLAKQMIVPVGCEKNSVYWWDDCDFSNTLTLDKIYILFDPQTSGGLLISVSSSKSTRLLEKIRKSGAESASIIGQIIKKEYHSIIVKG